MLAEALITLALLFLLFVLFYGPWQEVCTDYTRQIIFERRDRLFDMATSGKLDFNSEEYRTMRSTLEGCIRYAHDLTWPLLIIILASNNPERAPTSGVLSPSQALAKISNPDTRQLAKRQMDESIGALLIMAAMKSAIFAPIVGLMVVAAYCTRSINVFLAPARHRVPGIETVLTTIERNAIAHV